MYILFRSETLLCLCLSVVAVMCVVILVTADGTVTLLVAGVVIITDLFLAALIHYWGLTMNQIVVLNIILAIGTSVDYSTHIAYSYLSSDPPKTGEYNTPEKIRKYKA